MDNRLFILFVTLTLTFQVSAQQIKEYTSGGTISYGAFNAEKGRPFGKLTEGGRLIKIRKKAGNYTIQYYNYDIGEKDIIELSKIKNTERKTYIGPDGETFIVLDDLDSAKKLYILSINPLPEIGYPLFLMLLVRVN